MKFLLDVNTLIAWEHQGSPHHKAFHLWAKKSGLRHLHTCGMAELGFIRVSMQVFGYTLLQSQEALAEMKTAIGGFIPISPSPRLPQWAMTASKTSDAYLTQIAAASGFRLATFDRSIADETAILIF